MGLLSAGELLDGRYEILEEILGGGMGYVYKARDGRLGWTVAVKVLKEDALRNSWVVDKFRQEKDALAKIDHPNVARLVDAGELTNKAPYLVMRYVEGSSLAEILVQGNLALPRTATIIRQAGHGLAALHELGLVHRDIKPGNLMVADRDLQFPVKVIDLGIVRVLGTMTNLNQIPGTPLYMSPEQLNGRDATSASDIYALGLVAYEMLAGKHLFDGAKVAPERLLGMQQDAIAVKQKIWRLGVTEAAKEVIFKALSYEPSQRQQYDSNMQRQAVQVFGDDFARALTTAFVPTVVDGQNEDRPKSSLANWLTHHKLPIIALSALAVVVTIVALIVTLNRTTAPSKREKLIDSSLVENKTSGSLYELEPGFPTGPPPSGMAYATFGLTIWRLRPLAINDSPDAAREIVDDNGTGLKQEWVSQRIDFLADYITEGQKLVVGIEGITGDYSTDRGSFLYVINREQYADGTFGRARLIFPTLLTYQGENRAIPGQTIVLPGKDRPFSVKQGKSMERLITPQTGENFTIILSPWAFSLPKPLSNQPMELPDNLVASWEKYQVQMYRAKLRGGVGQIRTKREQSVGNREIADDAEQSLNENDPLPQVIYKGVVKQGNPAMITAVLRYRD